MSELPPNPHESDPVDELYRRASALDAGRPSESVRRAVLDHAAQLAARAAAQGVGENQPGVGRDQRRPARRRMWWKPAAFGTLAAAGLAGLLITPQFLTPRAPRVATKQWGPDPFCRVGAAFLCSSSWFLPCLMPSLGVRTLWAPAGCRSAYGLERMD